MTQQYASEQPQGYENYMKNIAIVGAGGQCGKYIAEALVKNGKHTVTAITRADSTNKIPEGVHVKHVDYNHHVSLVDGLKGQDVLVITMSVTAPPDTQTKLILAAADAGVPWVLPNEWGFDTHNEGLGRDTMLGPPHQAVRDQIEQVGKSSWIGVACSFWYEFSLAGGLDRYGFDIPNRKVIFIDDGNVKINTSTWPQVGRGTAALLGLKVLPEDEKDNSPSLSNFRNNWVLLSSFLVSQKDMFHSILRVSGTKVEDWDVEYQEHKTRYESGVADVKKGDMKGFARLMYTRVFYPDGSGDYESSIGLTNDVLGLPKEDLDEYTKIALQRVEDGQGDR